MAYDCIDPTVRLTHVMWTYSPSKEPTKGDKTNSLAIWSQRCIDVKQHFPLRQGFIMPQSVKKQRMSNDDK